MQSDSLTELFSLIRSDHILFRPPGNIIHDGNSRCSRLCLAFGGCVPAFETVGQNKFGTINAVPVIEPLFGIHFDLKECPVENAPELSVRRLCTVQMEVRPGPESQRIGEACRGGRVPVYDDGLAVLVIEDLTFIVCGDVAFARFEVFFDDLVNLLYIVVFGPAGG